MNIWSPTSNGKMEIDDPYPVEIYGNCVGSLTNSIVPRPVKLFVYILSISYPFELL